MKELLVAAWKALNFVLFLVGATVLWGLLLNEVWEWFGVHAVYVAIGASGWAFLTWVQYHHR